MTQISAGEKFRKALAQEKPLQIVGTINANHALLAKRAGYNAIYLSGGGVAAGSLGVPDLGISNLETLSILIILRPDIYDRIKSLFFFTNRFSLLTSEIILSHSDIGCNSKHLLKTLRLITKPLFMKGAICFFKAAGSITLPFASALHSYVPRILINLLIFHVNIQNNPTFSH